MRCRELLKAEVNTLLEGRGGLLLPSLAIAAPKIGVPTVRVGASEEPVRNVMLRLTQLFNVTGHPALTAPCGHTTDPLPIGVQLVGHQQRTPDLLQLARSLEPYFGPGMSG
jgi:aspartyl-tRNA(Asn)/glutamyl-tRNA(Gln) amidotransferase subunit A